MGKGEELYNKYKGKRAKYFGKERIVIGWMNDVLIGKGEDSDVDTWKAEDGQNRGGCLPGIIHIPESKGITFSVNFLLESDIIKD